MAEAAEEMELISLAIRRLMEEENGNRRAATPRSSGADADDLQLLSRLLSQVESTREELRLVKHSQRSAQQEDDKIIIETNLETQSENVDSRRSRVKVDIEMVKEIKEVKRQNFITHCLVSAMIILTVYWQISEVSFILKLRDGLSNPFKSLGRTLKRKITSVLRNPFKSLGRILKRKTTSVIQHQLEVTELPHLNMPALPHVSYTGF